MNFVLLVSEDASLLSSLRSELLMKPDVGHSGLEIEGYSSPSEALRRVSEAGVYFDAAIVDSKMEDMDGVVFLQALQELRADTIRIIVSDQADMAWIINLINKTHIDFFILKPWNRFDLKHVLMEALSLRELKVENHRLAESLAKVEGYPGHVKPKPVYRLMVVDDDRHVLSALRRELDEWDPVGNFMHLKLEASFFTSADQALDIAKNQPFDLVISDYFMPEINGIDFLQQLKQIRPDIAGILMSGSADVQVLVEAVNKVGICHFINKPWRNYELIASILQALAYRDLELECSIMADLARLGNQHSP